MLCLNHDYMFSGDDISYIVLSAVDYPVHVGRTDFFISGDYPNEPNPARSLFSIDISKFVIAYTPVYSTALHALCSLE